MSAGGMDERPIVAELGRPETPEEAAERKAAASAKRRANQTMFNLVLATLASLGLVAFLIAVVVRPDAAPREPVDYVGIAASADAGTTLAAPEIPVDWYANAATFEPEFDVPTWYVGFITTGEGYIGLNQGIGANPTWVDAEVDRREATGEATIAGIRWIEYDHRADRDPGNYAYALVAEFGDSTVVLHGTADDTAFALLAEAVAAELDS